MLQVVRYFTDNTSGEYATIEVRIANKFLPENLQEIEHHDDGFGFGGYVSDEDMNRIVKLYVSTKGRLTKKILCLENTELADSFCDHLIPLFNKRKYAKYYEIEVKIEKSHAIAKVNRWKDKHTNEINELLYG